jgi:hypothetical protein
MTNAPRAGRGWAERSIRLPSRRGSPRQARPRDAMLNNLQIFAAIRESLIALVSCRLLMPNRLVFAMALGFATAVHAGEDCTVYEDKNFGGRTVGLTMNQSVPALPENIDNRVSSVRVRPGCILVGFEDANFKGLSQTWGPGDYPALPKGWDDVISSVQCSCSQE